MQDLSAANERALADVFTYHPSGSPAQLAGFAAVRTVAKELARVMLQHCPPCADRSYALRQVRMAVMTANAAIALEGRDLNPAGEQANPARR